MLNLTPQQRIRIPDNVAVLAVLLLLVCSVAKNETGHEAVSADQGSSIAVKADSTGIGRVIDTAEKRSRGLNLGLLLFRRG
jgi:hypothetical protein